MHTPSWRIIGRGVYWLSMPDYESRLFENMWPIPSGVNYNAYLVSDGDECLLVDSSKNVYDVEEFTSLLKQVADPRRIKHVAVLHAEPDHSGLIGGLSSIFGSPMLYSTLRASAFMRSMFNVETRTVKDGEIIRVGGRALRVIELPWIHWPDTMLLYLEDEGILFSSDAFGAFGALEKPVFDDEADFEQYERNAKEYFATVVAAYRQMVLKALDKINRLGLSLRLIAPAHGVVLRSRIPEVVEELTSWCELRRKRKVTVVYGSMYGFTERLARLACGIIKNRVDEVAFHSCVSSSVNSILSDIVDSAGVVFITPTYEGNVFPPLSNIVELLRIKKMGVGKIAAVTVTKLWGGTAASQLSSRLSEAGFEVSHVCEYVNYPGGRDLTEYETLLHGFIEKALGKVE
ncbi:MAG: FprA family A-type flavoprotein [Thermoproteota archaeon]|nr:FprA family A-type flavoprotein [Candidatus Brockarchaeota archaeon]